MVKHYLANTFLDSVGTSVYHHIQPKRLQHTAGFFLKASFPLRHANPLILGLTSMKPWNNRNMLGIFRALKSIELLMIQQLDAFLIVGIAAAHSWNACALRAASQMIWIQVS